MIEYLGSDSNPAAFVIRSNEKIDGINFFSNKTDPQQIGLMTRPKGYIVKMHSHNLVERTIEITQEVLIIRSGKIMIRIVFENETFETVLFQGDLITLIRGSHELIFLDESQILEIKQGPYLGSNDKKII